MRALPVFAGTVAFGLFGFGAACSATPSASAEDLGDVIYEGGATDEALAAMTALAPRVSPTPLRFSAPQSDAKLPAASAPTFTWGSAGAIDSGVGLRSGGRRGPAWSFSPFGGGAAHAHGAALNGDATFVTFSTPANAKLVRVFTTSTTYRPSAEAWQKLSAANGPITASLRRATFDNNAVAAGGGPFEGTPVSFSVTP